MLGKALLPGFGNKVKKVGPKVYKRELIETAKKERNHFL